MNTEAQTPNSGSFCEEDFLDTHLSESHDHFSPILKQKTESHNRLKYFSTDEHKTRSQKKGQVNELIQTASKDLDTIKETFTKIEFTKDKFQNFLTVVREKLEIGPDNFANVEKKILAKIDELLRIKKECEDVKQAKEELQAKNDRQIERIGELEVMNRELEQRIQDLQSHTTLSSDQLKEYLKVHGFIVEKSSVGQILQATQFTVEEMAPIEKMHIDYKSKKLVVEYRYDSESLAIDSRFNKKYFEHKSVATETKSLLKVVSRLTRQFFRVNNLLLYHLSDLCRFMKQNAMPTNSVKKIYKELCEKEKTFENLGHEQGSLDKSLSSDNVDEDLAHRMSDFVKELLSWWKNNFNLLKEIQKSLTDGTKDMVNDMQNKLLQSIYRE